MRAALAGPLMWGPGRSIMEAMSAPTDPSRAGEPADAPPPDAALEGALLVAMPGMGDPRFVQTVIYVCSHGDEGAMGLIVNKPVRELTAPELLRQVGVTPGAGAEALSVHVGGPVETARGFVLHSDDWEAPGATKPLQGGLALTATIEILRDISRGRGPAKAVLALGYAGWAPGQLEAEILANGWLTCPADDELIFGRDDSGKWARALRKIGVDPAMLSSKGGRA